MVALRIFSYLPNPRIWKRRLPRGCVALRSRCAALRLADSRNGFGISTLDRSPRYLLFDSKMPV